MPNRITQIIDLIKFNKNKFEKNLLKLTEFPDEKCEENS